MTPAKLKRDEMTHGPKARAMAKEPQTLDDIFASHEAERRAEIEREETAEETARTEAKRKADHEKGVRLGWWTEDGVPIAQDENEDEDEAEDE